MELTFKRRSLHNAHCCLKFSVADPDRIRNFWLDPDSEPENKRFGSGFESGSETGYEINVKKDPYIQAKIR
jgi:hypothetical protein